VYDFILNMLKRWNDISDGDELYACVTLSGKTITASAGAQFDKRWTSGKVFCTAVLPTGGFKIRKLWGALGLTPPLPPFPFPSLHPLAFPPPTPIRSSPPYNPARGSEGALWAPPVGSAGEPQPKSYLVHFRVNMTSGDCSCNDFPENQLLFVFVCV